MLEGNSNFGEEELMMSMIVKLNLPGDDPHDDDPDFARNQREVMGILSHVKSQFTAIRNSQA